MIIKNGFVRTSDEVWINLDSVEMFWVEKDAEMTYTIKALVDDRNIDIASYDAKNEALCALDDAFGYEG